MLLDFFFLLSRISHHESESKFEHRRETGNGKRQHITIIERGKRGKMKNKKKKGRHEKLQKRNFASFNADSQVGSVIKNIIYNNQYVCTRASVSRELPRSPYNTLLETCQALIRFV